MLLSQHGLNSLASMIITQLPFPSLPIVALRQTESDGIVDDVCSSHDLLSRGIAVQVTTEASKTAAAARSREETKIRVLHSLPAAIQAAYQTPHASDAEKAEAVYAVFCAHFREFMQAYPRTSTDLRFLPMSAVAGTDLVVAQSRTHLQAMLMSMQNDSGVPNTAHMDYKALMCAYGALMTELA